MRFELTGKTKATLTDIDIQSLKKGQTEVVPAVALTLKVTLPNAKLAMLGKRLLGFFFEKSSPGDVQQQTLDGVEVISDMPALTLEAEAIGPISWGDEQTGCTLAIHQAVTMITLRDGTVKVKKITPKEGGACEFIVSFYTADVDAEVLGELGVLKSHDLDIELTLPEPLQQDVEDDEQEQDATDAFIAGAQGDGNPFGANLVQDDADTAPTREDVFGAPKNDTVVSMKKRRTTGKGLGTDADQAARQAEVLAQDSTMAGAVD